ncbi:MAG: hypothetical protein ABW168_08470 [Sedimenticola sp.]
MEEQFSSLTITLSIASSLVASWLFFYYLRFREKKIRRKIEELESEEEYIEKLSKGNIKLLRSTFIVILFAFVCLLIALAIYFVTSAAGVGANIKQYANVASAWFVIVGAAICIYQARSIIRAADLNKSKKKIQKQREALESRL